MRSAAFDGVGSRGAGLWILGLASTNAMSTPLGPPTSLRRRLSEGTNGFNILNAALTSNNLGGRVRSATHTRTVPVHTVPTFATSAALDAQGPNFDDPREQRYCARRPQRTTRRHLAASYRL